MSKTIPAAFLDLMEKNTLAHLATVMPDGSPQVSPIWFDYVGGRLRVNSARERVKDKNMERDHRVALSIVDPDNAYRCLMIRGRVVDITERGADAHIDALAKKYLGVDAYPFRRPGERRVIYTIEPLRVTGMP